MRRAFAFAFSFALALAFSFAFEEGAWAHAVKVPKRDRVRLAPDGVEIECEYVVGAGDAQALRGLMKNDRARIERYLVSQATHFVKVTANGKDVALVQGETRFAIDDSPKSNLAVSVTLSAKVALRSGTRVVIFDRHKDRKVTVPVVMELAPDVRIETLPPQPVVFDEHPLELQVR